MIGICVVYLVSESEGYDLLRISLDQLERQTSGAYRIYGCCPNGDTKTLELMNARGVLTLPSPPRDTDISQEHARALDILVDRAIADGCTHIATFDMDSWPILDGWNRLYTDAISGRAPVTTIVRTEMGDNFPFAAFTMFSREFWHSGASSFSTKQRAQFDLSACALSSRPGETGSGILAQLHRDSQKFLRLERSNRWNLHPIIAGIYDNTIFHLGAGSRKPRFVTDDAAYSIGQSPVRRAFADAANQRAREFAIEQLVSNHDAFIRELVGDGALPLRPIETDPQALPKRLDAAAPSDREPWPMN